MDEGDGRFAPVQSFRLMSSEKLQVILYKYKIKDGLLEVGLGLVECQSKSGSRRTKQGKLMPCQLFASGTEVVHVKRMAPLSRSDRTWYVTCLSEVDILQPAESVLGELTQASSGKVSARFT